jgi:nucleoside-diphosphate-sugar epimerase
VYVKNVVEAMIFFFKYDEFLQGTYFVADKEILTVKEVMQIMARAIGAKPPWRMPSMMASGLSHFPYVGGRLKFFLKDRVYSIAKITSLGFNPSYPAPESLIMSCRSILRKNLDITQNLAGGSHNPE